MIRATIQEYRGDSPSSKEFVRNFNTKEELDSWVKRSKHPVLSIKVIKIEDEEMKG